ncbi:MAG: T9SS type A sorting domain-containing protein [Lewinellaceae bacterium]|nr:T9SS type A sorting domain-containing protein [Lewinellaceae bacterium]
MKHLLFFICFLGMALAPVFSQKNLSPSVKPYAENWTYTLVKSLNRAGFDMPAMPAPATGFSGNAPLQLDSTKTFFNYTGGWPGDSTPIFRTTCRYPQPGLKIETEFIYENGSWLPLNRASYYTDDQQRLLDILAEVYDPEKQDFRLDSWLQIFPHGNSDELLDSVFTYAWDTVGLDWARLFSIANEFDHQDQLTATTSEIYLQGETLTFLDTYAYDDNGDNHLIESFAVVDGFAYPDSRTEISYVEHRPIEQLKSVFNGLDFQPESRLNTAYMTFGKVRRTMLFEHDPDTTVWHLKETVDYKYDFAQRLSSRETIRDGYQSDSSELVLYGYIDDENLAIEMLLYWNEDQFDWKLSTKKYYYYQGLVPVRPTPRPALPLQVFPNPAIDQVRFQLDSEAGIQLFNPGGQLVRTQRLQAGTATLDLALLPPGLYTLTAQTDGAFYTGKIVKQ